MFCHQCGADQPVEGRFCIHCGAELPRSIPSSEPDSAAAAQPAAADPAPSAEPPTDQAAAPPIEAVHVMPPSPSKEGGAKPIDSQPAPAGAPSVDAAVPPAVEIAEVQPVDAQPVPMPEPRGDKLPARTSDDDATTALEMAPAKPDDQAIPAAAQPAKAPSPAPSTPPTERAVRPSPGLEIGGRFGDHSQWAASPLKVVTVNISQLNVFRVLDLPGSATPQQISRQAQRLSMLQRLGTGIHNNSLLSFAHPPDHEAIREATRRIRDPETRIVDELFWLWPLSPETLDGDEALERLRQQDHEGAVRLWRQADEAGHHDSVPCHNLAVFCHLLAIESELGVSGQVRLSKGKRSQNLTYWRESLTCWHRLCTSDAFWEQLADRIRKLDDPRLTTGTARRIRADLPRALLWMNATLAAYAVESGGRQRARDHVTLIRETNFDTSVATEVLRQTASPYRERIKVACAAAERETNEEPESGQAVALRLLDEAKTPLAVIDQLLPSGDPVRETAHDEVAVTVLRCQIGFANKTDRWEEAVALVEQALAIAESSSMRQRIKENREICRGNLEYANCWFCKEEPGDDSAALEVQMHKVTARIPTFEGTTVQFRSVTVRVPRCKACQSAHTVPYISAGLAGMLGGLLGIGPCAAVVSANSDAVGVGWALLGGLALFSAVIGYSYGRMTHPLVTPESAKNDFSAVRKLMDEGFSFGEKPSE